MILSWFRSSSPISILLFASYLVLTQWGLIFGDFEGVQHDTGPFASWINSFLSIPWVFKLSYVLVCTYIAVIVNQSLNKLRLSTFENSLFGLVSILYISITSSHSINLEMMFALALLSHALLILINIESFENITRASFDIGFLVGLSSLFVMPIIYTLPALLIGMSILRPFNIKDWALMFTGVITVYFITFSFMFWQNLHYVKFMEHFTGVYQLEISEVPQSYWGVVGSGAAFLLWAAGVVMNRYRNLVIVIRNQITVLLWFTAVALAITITHFQVSNGILAIMTLPAVYIMVLAMTQTKRWRVAELIHLLVLCGLIYQQYLIFAD